MSNSSFLISEGFRAGASSSVPWWRETAVVASTTHNAINIFNASSSNTFMWVAPYSGRVIGASVGADANLTAGTLTLEVYVGGSLSQSFTALSNADSLPKILTLATPASFNANQTVDFRYTSDAALATLTIIQVIPIIVFD